MEFDEMRFWEKVKKRADDECWGWAASLTPSGYGQFGVRINGKHRPIPASRVSYFLSHGPIPVGMFVCHSCDNPICVNPSHLFLGSPGDNSRDAAKKKRLRPFWSRGETHPKSRTSNETVLAILRAPGKQEDIAKQFGVSQHVVTNIKTGRTWGHVTGVSFHKSKPRTAVTVNIINAVLAEPGSHRRIAKKLGISHGTVGKIKSIYCKEGCNAAN